jgi:hypothetical protein
MAARKAFSHPTLAGTVSCTTGLALAFALVLAGCGAAPQSRFLKQQREMYALGDRDLGQLQFFVSNEVVAHALDTPGAAGVLLMAPGTPGVAVGAGPNWIRVRFQQGGQGVVFVADPSTRGGTGYALATEVDGAEGYRLVRDVPDRILSVGGQRFQVVKGAHAELMVDTDKLRKLIAERPHVQGQRVPEP